MRRELTCRAVFEVENAGALAKLVDLAHVEQQSIGLLEFRPIGHGHVTVQNVFAKHARKIDTLALKLPLGFLLRVGLLQGCYLGLG